MLPKLTFLSPPMTDAHRRRQNTRMMIKTLLDQKLLMWELGDDDDEGFS